MNSSLQLSRSFFDVVSVEAVESFDSSLDTGGLHGGVDVTLEPNVDDTPQWGVVVEVRIDVPSDGPPPPYRVRLRIAGLFDFSAHADMPEEQRRRTVGVNGASMLYSSAREYLHILTSRGPWGGISLPTVDFRQVNIVTKG